MASASYLAHASLAFANPISEAAVDEAIALLPLPAEALVLDSGCGSGRHATPETLAYAQRIRRRRALPDGTDTLGFALLLCVSFE